MQARALERYKYVWPTSSLADSADWGRPDDRSFVRHLDETAEHLSNDSRWPAFFPAPLCFVTTGDGARTGLEKVVGASIVNRFPYVLALSFCRETLSNRHYARRAFATLLENDKGIAVQFLPGGEPLDRVMGAIGALPDHHTGLRIAHSGLGTRAALTNQAPVFEDAYMVYEGRLVRPGTDFEGHTIYTKPWIDVGSHRVYFVEITAIQLRRDVAEGHTQIHWRSLPAWEPQLELQRAPAVVAAPPLEPRYEKRYTPQYEFPSRGTIAFEADAVRHGMAIKYLPPLPQDQVEVDNDRARWPCFFPCSAGMITAWAPSGLPNLMPCGSTTIVSRRPLVIAPCVSYAAINERYAPRATLDILRRTRRFGCGVPFINDTVLRAIKYSGNTSLAGDPEKLAHAGLEVEAGGSAPVLPALPVHFDCRVIDEVRLGTHIMFLGEVQRIRVRADVTPRNPLEWCPWADLVDADEEHARGES
jgi:flavin reductase (DIM6/NTAB) family NADH-FMN oxidoreductase RutF